MPVDLPVYFNNIRGKVLTKIKKRYYAFQNYKNKNCFLIANTKQCLLGLLVKGEVKPCECTWQRLECAEHVACGAQFRQQC